MRLSLIPATPLSVSCVNLPPPLYSLICLKKLTPSNIESIKHGHGFFRSFVKCQFCQLTRILDHRVTNKNYTFPWRFSIENINFWLIFLKFCPFYLKFPSIFMPLSFLPKKWRIVIHLQGYYNSILSIHF